MFPLYPPLQIGRGVDHHPLALHVLVLLPNKYVLASQVYCTSAPYCLTCQLMSGVDGSNSPNLMTLIPPYKILLEFNPLVKSKHASTMLYTNGNTEDSQEKRLMHYHAPTKGNGHMACEICMSEALCYVH